MEDSTRQALRSAVASLDQVIGLLADRTTTRTQIVDNLQNIRRGLACAVGPSISTPGEDPQPAADAPTAADRGKGQRARLGHLQTAIDFFGASQDAAGPAEQAQDRAKAATPPVAAAAPEAPVATRLPKLSQQQSVGLARSRDVKNLKAEARAGTGKTTFLVGYAEQTKGNGLYLAYNRDIATAAQARFPKRVVVRNWHALAYRCEAEPFRNAGKAIRDWRTHEIVKALELSKNDISRAFAAKETLAAFLNSTSATVDSSHVPLESLKRMLKRMGMHRSPPAEQSAALAIELEAIARHAATLWDMSRDLKTDAPMPHDGYLRIWHDKGPELNADFLLFDEAQDFTPVMRSIALAQRAPKILAGDRWQQLYGYRGAVNAMQAFDCEAIHLTESYRFGQAIADAANNVLRLHGENQLLIGVAKHPTRVGAVDRSKPYAVLSRSNVGVCVRAAATAASHPTAILGDRAEIVELMTSAFGLYTQQPALVTHQLLRNFESFRALEDYVTDTGDRDCSMMVKLVNEHGTALKQIIAALKTGLVEPSQAHVVLSTVHKAKGLEWDQVILDEDYQDVRDKNGQLRVEECNILYVAATRARMVLEPNSTLQQVGAPPMVKYPTARNARPGATMYPTNARRV